MRNATHPAALRGMALAAFLAAGQVNCAEMPRGAEASEPVAFEDWALVCAEICDARTTLENGEGTPILTLRAVPGEVAALILETPLPLFLPDGAELALGASEPRPIPWRTCGGQGCEARVPLSPDLLAELRRERSGAVTLTLEDGSRVRLGVSLLGFTAAWRALSDAP